MYQNYPLALNDKNSTYVWEMRALKSCSMFNTLISNHFILIWDELMKNKNKHKFMLSLSEYWIQMYAGNT